MMVVCPVCGKYLLDDFAEIYLRDLRWPKNQFLYRISHATRSVSERAAGKRDNSLFPTYSADDFEKMLDQPDPSVQEKLHSLLRFLGGSTAFPGQALPFELQYDYSVPGARNNREARFLAEALNEQGFLTLHSASDQKIDYSLTARGWSELDRLSASGTDSPNAFIAMWFDPSRSAFDDAICQAVTEAGYVPVRMDRHEHLNRIDDEIMAQIRQSRFLIADFTGQRNGVYFEAGFMLGLGRPVIWVCDATELYKVHFDTRQYNIIDYAHEAELKTRLRFRIEANLGKGPRTTS